MTSTSPNEPTMMFEGLRSRWTIRLLWEYATASPTFARIPRSSRSSSLGPPGCARICASDSPAT